MANKMTEKMAKEMTCEMKDKTTYETKNIITDKITDKTTKIKDKFQVGIYGKGGIGKSTITANLSASLGNLGKKVLQIGCDPKSDSTKLLLNGKKQQTILDILKDKSVSNVRVEDFIDVGYGDVYCIEAGGPKAGVGCAGRGIITMVEVLKNKGIFDFDFDYIFYDILGDVVCGGFSVPLREGFADGVIIVTSGEFQSLYAANNICKGISNLNGKLIGIIGNSRNINNEKELIEEFCSEIGSELLAFIPNDKIFRQSEVNRKTLIEYNPENKVSKIFLKLAEKIINNDFNLKKPVPMDDESFELLNYKYLDIDSEVASHSCNSKNHNNDCIADNNNDNDNARRQEKIRELSNASGNIKKNLKLINSLMKDPLERIYSKSIKNRETLHGCSLAGAFSLTSQISDCMSIMHAPPGCGYISNCAYSNAGLIEKIYNTINYPSLDTRLMLTNIREEDVIFGGKEILQNCLKTAVKEYGWKRIFIITSCVSAIIGDNIENAINELKINDDADFTVIDTQGVIGGDYFQGMIDTYRIIAEKYINKEIIPKKSDCLINILNEKAMLGDADYNYQIIEKLLAPLGINVNCRYIRDTTIDKIKDFKRASITLPYDDGFISCALANFLREEYGVEIFCKKLPAGFNETCDWLTRIADYFGKEKFLKQVLDKYKIQYEQIIEEQRKVLSGKSILIFSYNSNLNWIVKTIMDLDMKLRKICFVRSAENEDMLLDYDVDTEYGFNESKRYSLIKKLKPDIVLTHITPVNMVEDVHYDKMPHHPKLGFFSGLELSKKWVQIFSVNLDEEWRNDKKLFSELQFKS